MLKIKREKSIRLERLIRDAGGSVCLVSGNPSFKISSIEYNSRKVDRRSLFVAIPGFTTDGHSFVMKAVESGASAVVVEEGRAGEFSHLESSGVAVLSSGNTRKALASLSASFFGYPCRRVPVIGITGTNGKTSITYMLESIFSSSGYSPGVIGTINYRWCGRGVQSSNTTPESRDLQEIFSSMITDGVDVIIMEVSSHGLKLFRTDEIDFDVVVFTNLTRDHLDFHDTFDDYFSSKRRIFTLLEQSKKEKKCAIVNIDNEYGRILYNEKSGHSYPVFSVGVDRDADYYPDPASIQSSIDGLSYVMDKPEHGAEINLKVAGRFHVYNSLCAFASAHRLEIPFEKIQGGLSQLRVVPGRFDRVESALGFNVVVDYAHTDDALVNLLRSAKDLSPGKIITVFGCGGNRDKTKRPLMGKAAVSCSDWVIITSDNPRNEKPEEIIQDIVEGLDSVNFEVEPSRRGAIKKAINMAEKGDLVVIAGKGHENYQIIGDKKIDFDDKEVAAGYIKKREMEGDKVEN